MTIKTSKTFIHKKYINCLHSFACRTQPIAGQDNNEIGDEGASKLAQYLQGSSVHTLHLASNQIGDATQQLLRKKYPQIN